MATVVKDFKVKNGLIVEGTTGTINNHDILTKKQDDQDYIVNLIGGTATSANTPNTVVKRDANGNFAAGTITADLTGDVTGNADTATSLETSRTITLGGDLSGSVSFDGSQNVTLTATVASSFATDTEVETAKNQAIAAAETYTDGEIQDEVIARDAAILLAKNDAIADAASDATTKANAALADANDYTDAREIAITTAYELYADNAATTAENNAKAYADGLSSGLNWKAAVNLLATSNVNVAGDFVGAVIDGHAPLDINDGGYRLLLTGQTTDSENGIWELSVSGATLVASRPADADAFSELVGAAVFVMEGNNYASTAWVQADHYLSSFAGQDWTQFSGQGTYLAGNGLTLDGTTFEIDETVTATRAFATAEAGAAETAANTYTDTREGIITTAYEGYADGVALTAEQNANIYTDGKISDEVSDRNNAITNAINALSTTDIEEGTNEYFTDAKAKTSAADLLTGPGTTLTNITITGNGSGLVITAENGVADSTTADLAEDPNATGSSGTMYFTDARAVSALEAVVPNFTAVELNSVAKQVAATASIATASTNTAVSWLKAEYRSAEFLVKIANGSHTDVSKVILTLDTSDNVAITEYAMVGTNGSLGSVSADVSGNDVRLRVTTANNTSTVAVIGTLLA
jgi:hypothetical protein